MQRVTLLFAVTLCAVVHSSFLATASADTVYVSAAGSDSNDGSSGAPFRTITHALAAVDVSSGSGFIVVAHGHYSAASGETFPLVMKSNVSLYGEMGAKETIIDASDAVP